MTERRRPAHHLPPELRLVGRRDQPGPGEILPEQQRGLLDGGQRHVHVREFGDDLGDRLGRDGARLDPVLAEQQRAHPGHQVRMEQP
ncbi:hypothetical protein GA0115255_115443, partial [Streptomyces sp. Ncost-T6T-2b]